MKKLWCVVTILALFLIGACGPKKNRLVFQWRIIPSTTTLWECS